MKNKVLFSTILISLSILLISAKAYASVGLTEITTPAATNVAVPTVKFSSVREMLDFGYELSQLANEGQCDQVLSRIQTNYSLPSGPNAIGDVEKYYYNSTYAELKVRFELADKSSNFETKKTHYERMIAKMNAYEEMFLKREWNPTTMENIRIHSRSLFCLAEMACGKLLPLYNSKASLHELRLPALLKGISYGEEFIRLMRLEMSANESRRTEPLTEPLMALCPQVKADLVNLYFMAYQIYYDKGKPCLYEQCSKRMQRLHEQLKGTEHLARSKEAMDSFSLFIASKKTYERSQPLAGYRNISAAKKKEELLEKLKSFAEPETIEEIIIQKSQQVSSTIDLCIRNVNLPGSSHKASSNEILLSSITQIHEMENFIKANIDLSTALSEIEQMRCVYHAHQGLMGDLFNEIFVKYLTTFLCAGDLEGALLRTQAAEGLFQNDSSSSANNVTRVVMALVKNLNGDYADWLALEEEVQEIIALQKASRSAAKAEAHSNMVADIKQFQEEASREAARKEKNKAKKARNKANRKARAAGAAATTEEYDSGQTTTALDDSSSSYTSSAQLKAEKAERHKIREAERAAAREEQPLLDTLNKATDIIETGLEFYDKQAYEDRLSDDLQTCFSLSGVAARVNNAIRTNIWDFTRGELEAYYEAMGCVKKQGKGSHEKVQLPRSVTFLKGNEVVTIVNEFAGALTLPRWDDFVPQYLRKQIQMARETLRDLITQRKYLNTF